MSLTDVETKVENELSVATKRTPWLHKLVTKQNLLIAGASLIVLVTVITSIALYQRHKNVEAAQAAAIRQDAITAERARLQEVAILKTQISTLQAQKKASCDYLALKARTKPTAGYVIVPTVSGCQQ